MNTLCDVLVIGGGVSGTAAAIAASRSGVNTILVEKRDFLGGAGYLGMFQNICGLYLNGDAFPTKTLNQGIVREVVGILNSISPHRTIKKIGQVYVLPYHREDLRSVFSSLCDREKNLTLLCNTTAVNVEKQNDEIVEVIANRQGTLHSITPRILIDCSGSGDVSAMAGAQFELSPPERLQLAGYTVYLKGLIDLDETLAIKVPYYLSKAVSEKILPPSLRFTTFSPGDAPDEGYYKISIDGAESTERDQKVKKDTLTAHRYLANAIPSFKNSYIVETSSSVMDREGRRVCGDLTLTEEDVLNARKFHDGVVKNSWPIEIWDKNKGTIYKYLKHGEYYEIPFRCLKVKGVSNLLCAGRCISVSAEALGSTRVMGTCMALGDQAGQAAAFWVKNQAYPFGAEQPVK